MLDLLSVLLLVLWSPWEVSSSPSTIRDPILTNGSGFNIFLIDLVTWTTKTQLCRDTSSTARRRQARPGMTVTLDTVGSKAAELMNKRLPVEQWGDRC